MKYYLSGAITLQLDFKDYFKKHVDILRYWGLTDIFNPAAVDFPKDVKWETCMKYDLKVLMDTDVLVLLPNWRRSRGAALEILIAKKLHIRVILFEKLLKEVMIHAS